MSDRIDDPAACCFVLTTNACDESASPQDEEWEETEEDDDDEDAASGDSDSLVIHERYEKKLRNVFGACCASLSGFLSLSLLAPSFP